MNRRQWRGARRSASSYGFFDGSEPRWTPISKMTAFRPGIDTLERALPKGVVSAASPRQSFEQIYEEHFVFVWRSSRRLGAPPADLDDVVQEIFVIAHGRLAEFEGRSSVKTWLFGIVLNVVRSHRRGLRAKHPHVLSNESRSDPEALADLTDGPHELSAKAEAARQVDQLLEALDDDKREVFVLAELEQLTGPEMALLLDIPLNTIYSRLRLARQAFAEAAARYRTRQELERVPNTARRKP
jgi:RNA polymerase sigma-70 factor (ECF subfamily)